MRIFFEIGSICKILKLLTLLEANCTFSITLRPRFVRYNHSLIHDYSYSRCLKISKIHEANVCVPYQKVVIFIDYIDGNSSFEWRKGSIKYFRMTILIKTLLISSILKTTKVVCGHHISRIARPYMVDSENHKYSERVYVVKLLNTKFI